MEHGEPGVRIVGLRKQYPGTDRPAVDALDLEIATGALFALVGASGCGKTTTMRCVAGLEDPDEGEIYLGETLVFSSAKHVNVPPYRRRVGMVFQSYAIWPHMTVAQNVSYPLRNLKLPKREVAERTADALQMVGLAHMSDRPAPRLSGGEQQRVALARALVGSPEVLLLDEPLSNLDAKLREQMRVELQEIQRRLAVTAIYVTHDQDEAFSLSDTMAIMDTGRLIEHGPPSDVYSVPRTSIGARFLGVSTAVEGVVESGQDGLVSVKTSIGAISCRIATDIEPGAGVVAYVRPEDLTLHLTEDSAPPAGTRAVRARLERVVYHGSIYEWTATSGEYRFRGRVASDSADVSALKQSIDGDVSLWLGASRCVPAES